MQPSSALSSEPGPGAAPALHRRSCPLCGRASSRVWLSERFDPRQLDGRSYASRKPPDRMHFRLMRCAECDLLYSDPAPSQAWIAGEYEGASFDAARESAFAARSYAGALREALEALPDRAGALDIGAGDGAFLTELLELGFTGVVGMEPSRAPVESAPPAVRGLLRQDAFREADFDAGSLSLVTCFQTIEHVENPLALIRSALRLLKPGGLFAVAAHSFRAWSTRLLRERSPIYDIEHLQLFSPRSLGNALAASGFQKIVVRPLVNSYPTRYWIRMAPLGRLASPLVRALEGVGLADRALSLPAGNLMAFGFKDGSAGA